MYGWLVFTKQEFTPLSDPFLNPLFPLASLSSRLALLIDFLSSQNKNFMFHSVRILSQVPLARGSCAPQSVLLMSSNHHTKFDTTISIAIANKVDISTKLFDDTIRGSRLESH